MAGIDHLRLFFRFVNRMEFRIWCFELIILTADPVIVYDIRSVKGQITHPANKLCVTRKSSVKRYK